MPNQTFDLPIVEVKGYIEDLMQQIGEDITLDGVQTRVMIADLEKTYNNMQQNMKRVVFLYDAEFDRGSDVVFDDDRNAIVFTVPNDDIVSKSAQILLYNSEIQLFRNEEQYDTDPNSDTFGDIVTSGLTEKTACKGFIERLTAKEKQFDVGLLHDAILRFVTTQKNDIQLGDIAKYKNKQYRVIDADDITDGILVVQLANVRE